MANPLLFCGKIYPTQKVGCLYLNGSFFPCELFYSNKELRETMTSGMLFDLCMILSRGIPLSRGIGGIEGIGGIRSSSLFSKASIFFNNVST